MILLMLVPENADIPIIRSLNLPLNVTFRRLEHSSKALSHITSTDGGITTDVMNLYLENDQVQTIRTVSRIEMRERKDPFLE